jgi:hypothetical protein
LGRHVKVLVPDNGLYTFSHTDVETHHSYLLAIQPPAAVICPCTMLFSFHPIFKEKKANYREIISS